MSKTRSRLLILNRITQFGLVHLFPGGQTWGSAGTAFSEGAEVGDLVAIQSASPSKWYLSWLVSIQRPQNYSCDQYTLESIEDGELCNWHNVGLIHMNRKEVNDHPEWKWTDKQHEFKDRWFKVCYKKRDAYIYVPLYPVFHDKGFGVDLKLRGKFGLGGNFKTFTVPDYRRVTLKALVGVYDDLKAAAEEKPAAKPSRTREGSRDDA